MSPLNTNDLNRIFHELDKNNDSFVSLDELNWLLDRIGVHLKIDELESLVGKTSLDFNDFLSFYESITTSSCNHDPIGDVNEVDEALVKAFEVFDVNGDGLISCEEVRSVLSRLGLWRYECEKDCERMISVYDMNMDGYLDYEEFKNMMLNTSCIVS